MSRHPLTTTENNRIIFRNKAFIKNEAKERNPFVNKMIKEISNSALSDNSIIYAFLKNKELEEYKNTKKMQRKKSETKPGMLAKESPNYQSVDNKLKSRSYRDYEWMHRSLSSFNFSSQKSNRVKKNETPSKVYK